MKRLILKKGRASARRLIVQHSRGIAAVAALTVTTGCSHFAHARLKTRTALDEESRALTTAVVDALQLQPVERRSGETQLALDLAREDQRVEGLPLDPIKVEPLLAAADTNSAAVAEHQSAVAALATRFAHIDQLLKRERNAEQQLRLYGERFEQERNRRTLRLAGLWGSGSFGVAGLVLLCLFCPALIPIAGRVLSWIVAAWPRLAGWAGVVGVHAFDAIVKAVEQTKTEPSDERPALSNQSVESTRALDRLHLNFSREMDRQHKALVTARKGALGL